MKHQPAADEVVCHLADRQHQLGYQQHHHEGEVAGADTGVHYGLGDERQYQADDAGHEHRQEYLHDERLVRAQIAEDVAEAELLLFVSLLLVELGSRLQHQGYAVGVCRYGIFTFIVFPCLKPGPEERLLGIGQESGCGIGHLDHISAASLPYLIDHHEVPLVPVDDARQRHLVAELLPGDLHARRTEADALCCIAYPQHRHPLAGDVASLAEVLETVAPAVMPRNHTQARRAAVHRV